MLVQHPLSKNQPDQHATCRWKSNHYIPIHAVKVKFFSFTLQNYSYVTNWVFLPRTIPYNDCCNICCIEVILKNEVPTISIEVSTISGVNLKAFSSKRKTPIRYRKWFAHFNHCRMISFTNIWRFSVSLSLMKPLSPWDKRVTDLCQKASQRIISLKSLLSKIRSDYYVKSCNTKHSSVKCSCHGWDFHEE